MSLRSGAATLDHASAMKRKHTGPLRAAALIGAAFGLAGCSLINAQIESFCTEDGERVDPSGKALDGSCGIDAGPADSGAEAGLLDAGSLDGGAVDGGPDGGSPDSGIDAGPDAGPDSGLPDGGPPVPLDAHRRIATGWTHTCAINAGEVFCWGDNSRGQLGTGTTDDSRTPVRVGGLPTNIVEVSATGYFTCALSASGELFCWGLNELGQLGDGTRENRLAPVRSVSVLADVIRVSAGGESACALRAAGVVSCWGRGTGGALGNGMLVDSLAPVDVVDLEPALGLEGSGGHYCIRTEDEAVACWGWNLFEQLGQVYDGSMEVIPRPVSPVGLAGVLQASAGGRHTCVRTSSSVACWGWNMFGQLGNGGSGPDTHTPVVVAGLSEAASDISAGGSHTCALLASGAVLCWGGNAMGQLGAGDRMERGSPTPVSGFTAPVEQLSTGDFHTCALLSTGDVACWGGNFEGQLGNGTLDDSLTPQVVDVGT